MQLLQCLFSWPSSSITGCSLLAVAWLTIYLTEGTNRTVSWRLETVPIVFHENVTLKCTVKENCCLSSSRQWKRGNALISHDEGTVDGEKYYSELDKDGFILTIMDFSVEDYSQIFTCVYGFEEFTASLKLKQYELHPSSLNTSVDISLNNITVQIKFGKVCPIPECQMLQNETMVNTSLLINTEPVGLFVKVQIVIKYSDKELCGSYSILCKIGSRQNRIFDNKIFTSDCQDFLEIQHDVIETNTSKLICIVLFVVLFVVIIIITAVICVCIQRGIVCSNKDVREDGSKLMKKDGSLSYDETTPCCSTKITETPLPDHSELEVKDTLL